MLVQVKSRHADAGTQAHAHRSLRASVNAKQDIVKTKQKNLNDGRLRIFVSSTYRDLASYREVIKFSLEKSGFIFCGMELFSANPAPPLEVCLDGLRQCDIYIGVIGKLYGSLPPGKRKSYTEYEYDLAQDLIIDRFMFVLDDEAEVRPAHVEQDPMKLKRLTAFLEKIKRNHTIDTFNSPDQVAWKILASLRTYELRRRETNKKTK